MKLTQLVYIQLQTAQILALLLAMMTRLPCAFKSQMILVAIKGRVLV
jgi:hypothetical protein